MKLLRLYTCCTLALCALLSLTSQAQEGDQILDGIGETGLIARYKFDGQVKDWSRNNLHGQVHGSGVIFGKDDQFGQVVTLTENETGYISIPGKAFSGEESISVCGWVFLRSTQGSQPLLRFTKDDQPVFVVTPRGSNDQSGFEAILNSESGPYSVSAPDIPPFKWMHWAVVINTPAKTLSLYLNGSLAGETKEVDPDIISLFKSSGENTALLIGKSDEQEHHLNARLFDFRIYRIPLTNRQVLRIHDSALKKEGATVRTRREDDRDLQAFDASTPQLYNAFLTCVENIQVETTVGYLPRLPRYVKGSYSNGIQGPEVRVLWPAEQDNIMVQNPGNYTVIGRIPGSTLRPTALVNVKQTTVQESPERTLEAFDLDEVSLDMDLHQHETKFIENRDKFITGLAKTNPDNFLYMFRNAFGQSQPEGAEALGGWDSQQTKLRGHATGHYLSGIAQAYASTGYDPALQAKFASKMEYMVNTLYDLSQLSGHPQTPGGDYVADPLAVPPGVGKNEFNSDLSEEGIRTDYWNWGVGFISAYPPDQFIMLENGASYGGDNSKIWAPYYTLHKILAGLMDIYEVSGNQKALAIVQGMGDWVYARLRVLPKQTLINMWNRYIAGEFGGMNEAMARLNRLTGEPRYLEVAKLFDNIRVFYGDADHTHGLAKNVDMFRGLHANQHIPQIMGALEIYRDSELDEYYHIADNFWDMATHDYMYSIGGVAGARNPSNAECFTSQPATLYENGFSAGGQNETCATYNMLKLTRNLFLYDQRTELMDYYERGLYNHILASVDEHSAANTYHVPLRAGSMKHFGNADMDGFSCCNGTALESSTKLQNTIYFRSADNSALYVNLYVPSTLNWTEKNIRVKQTTAYPNEDHSTLTIEGEGQFALKVRVPKWATKGYFVTINGKKQKVEAVPGTYLTISRVWKSGDRVELRMPFSFWLDPVMDQQNIASLFYGPVLLAAQEPEARKEWRKVTLNAKDLGRTISGNPALLEFTIDGVQYKPFYETYGRHSVYLDVTLE